MSLHSMSAAILLLCCSNILAASDGSAVAEGERLFNQQCQFCHNGLVPEAPTIEALKLYPPERVIDALNGGVMSTAGLPLSGQQMKNVAYYLTGKQPKTANTQPSLNFCSGALQENNNDASWLSWGGFGNQRFQANEHTLTRDNISTLRLEWAFAFPETTRIRSQPIVTASHTYIGSQDGTVYALDTQSGCVHWTFQADAEVRGSLQLHEGNSAVGNRLLFGDFKANAYSIDAVTGKLHWKTRVHEHELATITGAVVADTNRLYVPVSSSEVVPAGQDSYPCCSFRGALAALTLRDGSIDWITYTTPKPVPTGTNSAGTQQYGPSGAPVWSGPTLDDKRGVVMITTGQNYSSPATGTSDAVIALDKKDGTIKWVSQLTARDAWNGACARQRANCPAENGPDFDIGAAAVLVETGKGRDLVFAGQKSGMVAAMDPNDNGEIVWKQRVGRGGTMGGVHWGMSSDGIRLYVGISDVPTGNKYTVGEAQPGVHALDPTTGDFLWRTVLKNSCKPGGKFACFSGISAAISSANGLVFAGGLDGILRAYDASDGDLLWSYNTSRDFESVNGAPALGGAIESDGPVIANGRVFVTSGYDKWAEMPGNVLLSFGVPARSEK
ncbi:MAG: PQQ-binding-like beta-propeller repeat protein [Pseudomonadota bacterium]